MPALPLPVYQTPGAAGFDLAASADVLIAPGTDRAGADGPGDRSAARDTFSAIFARSSTPLKRGLMVANGVGVIDEDYCGPADEVKIQVLNFTGGAVTVSRAATASPRDCSSRSSAPNGRRPTRISRWIARWIRRGLVVCGWQFASVVGRARLVGS